MGAEVGRGSLVDGPISWVRPVGSWVLESNNVVAEALAVSLDKPRFTLTLGASRRSSRLNRGVTSQGWRDSRMLPQRTVSSRSGFTSGLTQGWWLLCGQIKCRNQTGYGEDPIRTTIPRNDRSSFWCWRPTLYSSGWALIRSTATCSAL